MLTPSATSRRTTAELDPSPPPSSTAALTRTGRTTLAWATAAGLLLGVVAALTDALGGPLADLLSVPGPWIAAAAGVAVVAARGARASTAPAATAAFLVAGIAAYYVTKGATAGAVPGPLVVFWGVLAIGVGVIGGAVANWSMARPWGVLAITGVVAGWLVAEAVLLPAALTGEALAGLLGAGLVGRHTTEDARARWRAVAAGTAVGAIAAAGVFAVLSRALSAAL